MPEETCAANRWSQWFATLVFAIVALVSLTTSWGGQLNDQVDTDVKWAFSAIVISLCLSGLAVLAHVAKDKFVGTPVELGLAFIVMGLMAAALPAIMKPGNDIAVNENGGIMNANLYFFSWGTFFTALYVFMHFMQNVYDVGAGTKNVKFDKVLWVVLIATSLIAMSSASRLYKFRNCDSRDVAQCRRLQYAFSLGVISGIISFLWLLIGARCHMMLDAFLSVLMLVLWCFAVAYTTFGEAAPAYNLGNLYFSTWFSFVISCRLASAGLHNMFTSMTGEEGEDDAAAAPAEDEAPKDEAADKGKGGGDDEEAVPAAEEHNA